MKFHWKRNIPSILYILIGIFGLIAELLFIGDKVGVLSFARTLPRTTFRGIIEKVTPCVDKFLCFKIVQQTGPFPIQVGQGAPGGQTRSPTVGRSYINPQVTTLGQAAGQNATVNSAPSQGSSSVGIAVPGGRTTGCQYDNQGKPICPTYPQPDLSTCLQEGGTILPPVIDICGCKQPPVCAKEPPNPGGPKTPACLPRPDCLDNPESKCPLPEPPQGWCPPITPTQPCIELPTCPEDQPCDLPLLLPGTTFCPRPPRPTPDPSIKGNSFYLVAWKPLPLKLPCISINPNACRRPGELIDLNKYVEKYVELEGILTSISQTPYILVQSIHELSYSDCLPLNRKVDDVVIGGVHKITISEKLDEYHAYCDQSRNLVDSTGKPIYFYNLTGCWGNPPYNYKEILQKQQEEINQLRTKYNVIEMNCYTGDNPARDIY